MSAFNTSSKEHFLWKQNTHRDYWNRQYLNYEYYTFEKNQIQKTTKWYGLFRKAKDRERLPEVNYFVIKSKFSPNWLLDFDLQERFTYKGLSALKNISQNPLIAIFPKDKEPEDYQFVRITKSKKGFIICKELSLDQAVEPILIIEEYESIPYEKLYIDIPHKNFSLYKIFHDNLNKDEFTAKTLQAPIISAPIELKTPKGIGVTSLMGSGNNFVQLLFTRIQQLIPPDFRTGKLPEKIAKGKWLHPKGLKNNSWLMNFIEKVPEKAVQIDLSTGKNYTVIEQELKLRKKSKGEFSFIGNIEPIENPNQQLNMLWNNFTKTELTASYIEKIKETDFLVPEFRKLPLEEVWASIAQMRQFSPSIQNINLEKIEQTMLVNWETFSERMKYKRENKSESLILKSQQSAKNITKIAQMIARTKGVETIDDDILNEAIKLHKDSIDITIGSEEQSGTIEKSKQQTKNERIETIRTILNKGPKSEEEIWNITKSTKLYNNKEDLNSVLYWMHKKGLVYKTRAGWINS